MQEKYERENGRRDSVKIIREEKARERGRWNTEEKKKGKRKGGKGEEMIIDDLLTENKI